MNDFYNGFGPHGPANADIAEGVNYADLYEHAPDCNCYYCSGQAGDDEAYEAEIARETHEAEAANFFAIQADRERCPTCGALECRGECEGMFNATGDRQEAKEYGEFIRNGGHKSYDCLCEGCYLWRDKNNAPQPYFQMFA